MKSVVHAHSGGVVCEYNQMYSYWFRPWLLSQPDSKEEQLEGDGNDVNANQGASQSVACRVKANDLGSTLFGDFPLQVPIEDHDLNEVSKFLRYL